MTVTGALSYGELASMMPRAGGQYVYLREAFSPLWGFLYGWTLFLVIQTGTIAAVAIGFARFLGVLWPRVSETNYIIPPVHISSGLRVVAFDRAVGWHPADRAADVGPTRAACEYGKIVQNIFTTAKMGALAALIVLGLLIGWNANAVHANFGADFWTPRGVDPVSAGHHRRDGVRFVRGHLRFADRIAVCGRRVE